MGDILNLNWSYLNVPYGTPCGKGLGINNYIFFKVTNSNLRPDSLFVFVKDASEQYDMRGMGMVQDSMIVPSVVFPPRARLVVTGLNNKGQKVQFNGVLKRGSHYILDHAEGGHHKLSSYISTENCPCCPYDTSY